VHKPRKHDAWQLPQGGTEKGETFAETALRELKEETGLDLPEVLLVSDCVYTYEFPPEFLRRHRPVNQGQTLNFVVIEASPDAKVQVDAREIDSYVWVLPEQIEQYIHRKEYLEIILKVYAEYRAKCADRPRAV
jgi:putative (di)nucleoside polyphosphate hydrolase